MPFLIGNLLSYKKKELILLQSKYLEMGNRRNFWLIVSSLYNHIYTLLSPFKHKYISVFSIFLMSDICVLIYYRHCANIVFYELRWKLKISFSILPTISLFTLNSYILQFIKSTWILNYFHIAVREEGIFRKSHRCMQTHACLLYRKMNQPFRKSLLSEGGLRLRVSSRRNDPFPSAIVSPTHRTI